MKIMIVGTGAMGGVYAALFAEAGHEVWAIDTWREHVDAIKSSGLSVAGASGDRVVTGLEASTRAADAGVCDMVVIATKAADVAAAAASVSGLLGPDTVVVTIQNGLGSVERISGCLDRDRVLVGVAEAFGASVPGPGRVHHNSMKMIRLGEAVGGGSERLERIAGVWREAGFTTRAFDDIDQLVWEKFVCNVAYSGPCTVFGCSIGEALRDPEISAVSRGCAEEAFAAGRASGVAFSFDDAVAYVVAFGERMPAARPSMLLDHLSRRRSEIDAINGMVPVVARRVGTTAPYNEVVSAIVRRREREFGD